jgi:tRNA-dihydrouridine synthase A
MARCAKIAQEKNFDGININAGCPSERVFSGSFGACLMDEPEKVALCVNAMKEETNLPISIKTRIALDKKEDTSDGFDACCRFIETTSKAGCTNFIIHARKARLKGLTPKENRQKLPLNYPLVYKIKNTFPELNIIINGQILSLSEIDEHLKYTDGVMIGRWAYADPYSLKDIDTLYYNDNHQVLSRRQIIETLLPIIETYDKPLHATRHMMGLYAKTHLSKIWKQTLLSNNIANIETFIKNNEDIL